MALTRDFKETVLARAQRDARFREALFAEAINAYLAGDTTVGKAVLRDMVNATIGFEGLAAEVDKPSKSLHRMLAKAGWGAARTLIGLVHCMLSPNCHQHFRNTIVTSHLARIHTKSFMPRIFRLPRHSCY